MKRSLILTVLICFHLIINACSLRPESAQDDSPFIPSEEPPPTAVPTAEGLVNTGNLAAANREVAAVKMAVQTYQLNTGSWPKDSNDLFDDGYLDKKPEEVYKFNTTTGIISGITSSGKWITAGFSFDATTQKWQ